MKLKNENTNPKKLSEKKMLKEGPGAGYEIKTSGLSDIVINSVKLSRVEQGQYGFGGVAIEVDVTATVDEMYAESYYYGTGKMQNIPVRIDEVWANYDIVYDILDDGQTDSSEWDESYFDEATLMRCVEDALTYEDVDTSLMYGGGWMHSTYNGEVGGKYDVWHGYITDKDTIDYIDKAVSGENYTTEYVVRADGYDDLDYFVDEDSAIAYADEQAQSGYYDTVEVEKRTYYYDFDGEPRFDWGEENEIVYTADYEPTGDYEVDDYDDEPGRRLR
jgi:hypothetical protein